MQPRIIAIFVDPRKQRKSLAPGHGDLMVTLSFSDQNDFLFHISHNRLSQRACGMHDLTSCGYYKLDPQCFVVNKINDTGIKKETKIRPNACPLLCVHYEITHKNIRTATLHTIR